MKKKRKRNISIGVFLLATAVILSLLVIFAMRNPKEQVYYGVTRNGHPYHIYLLKDGTFDFVDPISSILTFHNEEDRYQWNDGMLMLQYADPEKVWYLRQEGETLVFEGEMSVLKDGDPRLNGVVFEKITE